MDAIGLRAEELLNEITKLIKDDLVHTELDALSVTAIYALAALHENDRQRASELAAAVKVPATSFTPTLDRLQNADLITRSAHPSDRRAVIVSLTARGETLRNAVAEALRHAEVKYGGVFALKSTKEAK